MTEKHISVNFSIQTSSKLQTWTWSHRRFICLVWRFCFTVHVNSGTVCKRYPDLICASEPSLMYNLMYWMHWEGQMSYFCVSFSSSYRNTQHRSQSLHDNASFKGTVHLKINTHIYSEFAKNHHWFLFKKTPNKL